MLKTIVTSVYVSTMLFGMSMHASASLLTTSSQSVSVSGKYLPENPPNVPDPRRDLSATYSGNNYGGISQFDFNLTDQGVDFGMAYWDVAIQQSSLKSVSDLRIKEHYSIGTSFTELDVSVASEIAYGDTITVRDLTTGQEATPLNLYVRFEVGITGTLFNDVIYDNPAFGGASVANYYSEASFSSRIANSKGRANEDFQIASTNSEHANGIFGSNVLERAFINSNVVFEDLLWAHSAMFIGWTFNELFNISIDGIDVGSIDINLQNNLGNTFVTRASVFDVNGNWLSNYAVASSQGFLYQQLSTLTSPPNAVSAPSSMMFMLTLLVGLIYRRMNS